MAVLNRITLDLVTEEELPETRLKQITREAVDYVHVILVEPEDQAHDEIDKNANFHVHDNNDGNSYCEFCVSTNAQDRLNGDVLVERG